MLAWLKWFLGDRTVQLPDGLHITKTGFYFRTAGDIIRRWQRESRAHPYESHCFCKACDERAAHLNDPE